MTLEWFDQHCCEPCCDKLAISVLNLCDSRVSRSFLADAPANLGSNSKTRPMIPRHSSGMTSIVERSKLVKFWQLSNCSRLNDASFSIVLRHNSSARRRLIVIVWRSLEHISVHSSNTVSDREKVLRANMLGSEGLVRYLRSFACAHVTVWCSSPPTVHISKSHLVWRGAFGTGRSTLTCSV